MDLGRPLLTVTPTLDGDVLTVMAKTDAAFTVGQLQRVLARYSISGLRKVLDRLAGQGVLLTTRVGGTAVYRFNHEHLAAEHIACIARLQETFLQRLGHLLESWEIRPVYAAVFGSASRGEMTAESDLDLLLVRPDDAQVETWDAQVRAVVDEVARWTGNDTRPLEFTVAEVVDGGANEPVLHDVLRHGLTAVGSRSWLAKQLRRKDRDADTSV